MSSTRQAVVRGPSLTGFGKRPLLMPAHQVERPTGIGPFGARMEERRRNPVCGNWSILEFGCAPTLTLELDTNSPLSSGDEPALNQPLTVIESLGRLFSLVAEHGSNPRSRIDPGRSCGSLVWSIGGRERQTRYRAPRHCTDEEFPASGQLEGLYGDASASCAWLEWSKPQSRNRTRSILRPAPRSSGSRSESETRRLNVSSRSRRLPARLQ
jgi:hypothetical protein